MKIFNILMIGTVFAMGGCNSVYLKPGSMEPGTKVVAQYGGIGMRRVIKAELENRGYDVEIGRVKSTKNTDLYGKDEMEVSGDTRYVVRVDEVKEKFVPLTCPFNGFWRWRFTVSIIDQETKKEILTWRGRGCAHSSIRKLNDILDRLEGKE